MRTRAKISVDYGIMGYNSYVDFDGDDIVEKTNLPIYHDSAPELIEKIQKLEEEHPNIKFYLEQDTYDDTYSVVGEYLRPATKEELASRDEYLRAQEEAQDNYLRQQYEELKKKFGG